MKFALRYIIKFLVKQVPLNNKSTVQIPSKDIFQLRIKPHLSSVNCIWLHGQRNYEILFELQIQAK